MADLLGIARDKVALITDAAVLNQPTLDSWYSLHVFVLLKVWYLSAGPEVRQDQEIEG